MNARRMVPLLLLLLLPSLASAALPGSGELRWRDASGTLQQLASLDTDVDIDVHGLVAEVQVKQRFRNDSADWLEAEYLLPLPDGAAVHAMTLHIGERLIVGEIREREAAREVFAQARESGHKAALVEAGGNNLFRTAVTNVAPGETVAIELHYWQRVRYRDGEFSLRFPLTYTPRYHMRQDSIPGAMNGLHAPQAFSSSDDGQLRTAINVALDAGVPLVDVASSSHRIVSQRHGATWQVHLQRESVLPDRDFILRWTPRRGREPVVAGFTQHLAGSDYAMLLLLPPEQPPSDMPRELILVIDTSGSMGGESIRQARAALQAALDTLTPRDRFNVIEFNSSTRAWRPQAVPATANNLASARRWVASLQANGGTEMAPALRMALAGKAPEGYLRQIVFATDAAVANPGGLLEMIDRDLGDSRLFPVGIGSAPNVGFLKAAARHGRGTWLAIADLDEVASTMGRLTAILTHPAVTDLAVDWPDGSVVYPQRMPDLYLGEPLLAVARLPQPLSQVRVSGRFGKARWSEPVPVGADGVHVGLARLWAQARIDDLEGRLARGGPLDELRSMIIKTALDAHLVSRFTSLVAVDRTPARTREALKHARIPNAMPAGTRFASTATGSRLWALLALLAFLLAATLSLVARRRRWA